MTTYSTGNPIGSVDVKDLNDNSQNLDSLVNGPENQYADRLGVLRKSWRGIENDAATIIANLGYYYVGPYAAGLVLSNQNQIFDRSGEYWRVKPGVALPLTLTGTWATDQNNVVSVGDAALRTDLGKTTLGSPGASYIGRANQVVVSIAELRQLLKTSASKFAFALGYHAAADGGGGPYYYDAADTTTADNGGSVIVAADGGRWKLAHNGVLSVKQFGAKGDGSTDDTAKIQATIDAFTFGMGRVDIPPGTFILTATLNVTKSYVAIRGSGMGTTTLKRSTNYGDTFKIQGTAPNAIVNNEISGINIWADVKPTSNGHINAIVANGLVLRDINMGESFVGIILQGCWQPTIERVYMTNAPVTVAPTNVTGLILDRAPAGYPAVLHGANLNVRGLEVYSGFTAGTNLPGWDFIVDNRCIDGAWFVNCYFGSANTVQFRGSNNDATPGVWNTGVKITNSWFDLAKGTAFQSIGSTGGNFGNYVFGNNTFFGGNQSQSAVVLNGNFTGFIFDGNRISNFTASGFAINSGSVKDITINGNKIDNVNTSGGGSGHGIWVINGSTINITGNVLEVGTNCNGVQVTAGNRVTVNSNNIHGFVNGVSIALGPVKYVVTGNNTTDNTTGIADGGGAVSKLVANNL